MSRVLIIDDESPMRRALEDALKAEGHRVLSAGDGERGLEMALGEKPDLLLLDVMMPRLDGFAVCAELRRLSFQSPILILTARGRVEDRVKGLDIGGDDYLVKPFGVEELLARVRALLRRAARGRAERTEATVGELWVHFGRQEARRAGREVHLTPKEFAMLRLLVEAEGQVVSRERFLDVVWGVAAFPSTRTVDTHMASLRIKVERDPNKPVYLKTVYGSGYRLESLGTGEAGVGSGLEASGADVKKPKTLQVGDNAGSGAR